VAFAVEHDHGEVLDAVALGGAMRRRFSRTEELMSNLASRLGADGYLLL
jgi:hypothetical protein